MIDVCLYYGQLPPEGSCPSSMYEQMIVDSCFVSSIDGYIGGEMDLYYCEFCPALDCQFNSSVGFSGDIRCN